MPSTRDILDSRAIHHVVVTAEAGSVRQAAIKLGMSQPGLSKSLRNTEEALGVHLFDRHPGGVRLTEVGEHLVRNAAQILAALKTVERDIREFAMLERGHLRVGSTPTAETILARALSQYTRLYPNIDVTVEVGLPHVLAQMVEAGKLDLLVSNDETLYLTDRLKRRLLRRDSLGFFASSKHPLSVQKNIRIEELSSSRLAMPFLTPRFSEWLSNNDIFLDENQGRIICNSYELLARLIADGTAVSIAPRYAIDELASHFDVVALDVKNVSYEVTLTCVLPSVGIIGAAAQKIIGLLEDTLGSNVRSTSNICD